MPGSAPKRQRWDGGWRHQIASFLFHANVAEVFHRLAKFWTDYAARAAPFSAWWSACGEQDKQQGSARQGGNHPNGDFLQDQHRAGSNTCYHH